MKTRFPGVCECIDCTHIAIVAPSGNLGAENNYPEHIYVNRKNYHSINIQLVRHFNNIHILYNVSQGEVTLKIIYFFNLIKLIFTFRV